MKGWDKVLFSLRCSNCLHDGKYRITQLVEENDYWRLFCESCHHELLAASHTEREKMIQGIALTEKYTPDIINAYKYLDKDTPSKISFGRLEEED
ncbi:hypothetical protein D3C86_1981390 [compost metagenome]